MSVGRGTPDSRLDYRSPNEREWTAVAGVWAYNGLEVYYRKQQQYALGMETPFLVWFTRRATCLPGDYVVFQLDDYVLILHMPTRRLGFLATGRSPLVVMLDREVPEEKD